MKITHTDRQASSSCTGNDTENDAKDALPPWPLDDRATENVLYSAASSTACRLRLNVRMGYWSDVETDGSGDSNIWFNLFVFLILGVASLLASAVVQFCVAFGSTRASIHLHEKLLLSVLVTLTLSMRKQKSNMHSTMKTWKRRSKMSTTTIMMRSLVLPPVPDVQPGRETAQQHPHETKRLQKTARTNSPLPLQSQTTQKSLGLTATGGKAVRQRKLELVDAVGESHPTPIPALPSGVGRATRMTRRYERLGRTAVAGNPSTTLRVTMTNFSNRTPKREEELAVGRQRILET